MKDFFPTIYQDVIVVMDIGHTNNKMNMILNLYQVYLMSRNNIASSYPHKTILLSFECFRVYEDAKQIRAKF